MINDSPSYMAWTKVKSIEDIVAWIKEYVPPDLAFSTIIQMEQFYGHLADGGVNNVKTEIGFIQPRGGDRFFKYAITLSLSNGQRVVRLLMVPNAEGTITRVETDLGRTQ